MKKIVIWMVLGFLVAANGVFAQAQPSYQAHEIAMAREGCQKPIGFFPTPSKLQCILTTFGLSQKDTKPKSLAMIFTLCQGRSSQPVPAGVQLKKYKTLGACFQDPTAITLINKELSKAGFSPIKIVNSKVLAP